MQNNNCHRGLHHFAMQVLNRILTGEEQVFTAYFSIQIKSDIHNRLNSSQLEEYAWACWYLLSFTLLAVVLNTKIEEIFYWRLVFTVCCTVWVRSMANYVLKCPWKVKLLKYQCISLPLHEILNRLRSRQVFLEGKQWNRYFMCATLLVLCLAGINLYEMASLKGLHNLWELMMNF